MLQRDEDLPFDQWDSILRDGEFEESLGALQAVVARLEAGGLRLNDAVRCYEVGTLLARRCDALLEAAELRISRLDDSETDGIEPLDDWLGNRIEESDRQ